MAMIERRRLHVRGVVQGVGFRPFIYRIASALNLAGHVCNTADGAVIEVEGSAKALDEFELLLQTRHPPLASIVHITRELLPPRHEDGFRILTSDASAALEPALIPPDISICDDCLRELRDPTDRRFRYPFINCTNCGPRFTIITATPYDRPNTTMATFELCDDCAREYHDPHDRRFHAQPVACPRCGPRIWLEMADNAHRYHGDDAIRLAQQALRDGQIVAIKGIGGFHLACDATRSDAVRRLRARKHRPAKPLAVMVDALQTARRFAEISDTEAALLSSREKPIVLLRKRRKPALALVEEVAPGNAWIGVMLPYSPLHVLLLEDMPPLVMTSGNLSDEPICTTNDEARERLRDIADNFLLHNREIHIWCDDSVAQVCEGVPMLLRRGRGYVPLPVRLSAALPPTLAVGGELKAALCLASGHNAWMSQHIGDVEHLPTRAALTHAAEHFMRLFRARPERVVCDLHPGYLSAQWAESFARAHDVPLIRVQHHHAHIAACLAEHGFSPETRVIGVSFDGTGYGSDGAIWGGEVLIANARTFERFAHLRYVPLPGGDAAIRKPYRAALAHLWASGIAWEEDLPCVRACAPQERAILRQQLERNIHCVPTSSAGRLFDALAALLGFAPEVSYEAQAAIELESAAWEAQDDLPPYLNACLWSDTAPALQLDPAPLFAHVIRDWRAGVAISHIARRVHATLAAWIVETCERARHATQLTHVVLSGGVFQNTLLLSFTMRALRAREFAVYLPRQVPINDGGLALGQVWVAGQDAA